MGPVTGEAALLLRATGGWAADPGVGGARARLVEVAGAALGADVVPSLGDGTTSRTVALGWLHEAVAGPMHVAGGLELAQAWVHAVWTGDHSGLDDQEVLARSPLGRPVDALATTTEDLYALTRAALMATDVGHRATSHTIRVAQAEAALALALDADDLALVAEVLWLWPLLDLPWSAPADFALGLVDAQAPPATGGPAHAAAFSTGVLNALLATARLRRAVRRDGERVLALPAPVHGPRWATAYRALPLRQRSALAPLVLTIVVRRAHQAHDVAAMRTAVKVALRHGLLDAPAASHTAAVVRRGDGRAVVHALVG
ncbi:hypothetical protein D9V37_09055 [Nocardioides mangrovicus]|uniref:DUF6895 domain-containing protein n=1 Tax=Nocardioides mangrovicus TaxID=2478913 RepID=A0A3L8P4T6_9ACTN|nr:hypothetical protein D9V37_09055 [Nocardioides mangrovicus]